MLEARNLYLIKHSMKPFGNYEGITINLDTLFRFDALHIYCSHCSTFNKVSSPSFSSPFCRSQLIVINNKRKKKIRKCVAGSALNSSNYVVYVFRQ